MPLLTTGAGRYVAAGGGGLTPTTFNPSDKGSNIVLSGGNLTATVSATGDQTVRSVASHNSTKYYFEYKINSPYSADSIGLGIANASASLSTYVGNTNSAGLFGITGNWYVNNVNVSSAGPTFAATQVAGVALDLTNARLWIKNVSSGSNWNGSGTADPATNVGGIDISGITGAIYAAISDGNSALGGVTANFGATSFLGAAPSGFTSGF